MLDPRYLPRNTDRRTVAWLGKESDSVENEQLKHPLPGEPRPSRMRGETAGLLTFPSTKLRASRPLAVLVPGGIEHIQRQWYDSRAKTPEDTPCVPGVREIAKAHKCSVWSPRAGKKGRHGPLTSDSDPFACTRPRKHKQIKDTRNFPGPLDYCIVE